MESQTIKTEPDESLESALASIQKHIGTTSAKDNEKTETTPCVEKKQKQNTRPAELVDMRLASRAIQSSFEHHFVKNLGKNNLLKFLREKNVLHKHGHLKNVAKIEYIEKDYFKTVNIIRMQGEMEHVYIKTLVTSTGIPYIASLIEAHISEMENNKIETETEKKTIKYSACNPDYLENQAA